MTNETDNAGRVLWFIAGAALGAAVALLYTPSSGAEIRRRLGERAGQGGRELLDRGRDLYERGRQMADEAADMYDRGRKLVEEQTQQPGAPAEGQA